MYISSEIATNANQTVLCKDERDLGGHLRIFPALCCGTNIFLMWPKGGESDSTSNMMCIDRNNRTMFGRGDFLAGVESDLPFGPRQFEDRCPRRVRFRLLGNRTRISTRV
jgi:hypothetical protein